MKGLVLSVFLVASVLASAFGGCGGAGGGAPAGAGGAASPTGSAGQASTTGASGSAGGMADASGTAGAGGMAGTTGAAGATTIGGGGVVGAAGASGSGGRATDGGTGLGSAGATTAGAAGTDGGAGAAPRDASGETRPSATATVPIMPTTGNKISGTGLFTDVGGIVTLVLDVVNCPPGFHAFHIHQNAVCGADGNAAGVHWLRGDGGELDCLADGTGRSTVTSPLAGYWTIGGPAASDVLLHAIIIHANGDGGPSGARIACGVVGAR